MNIKCFLLSKCCVFTWSSRLLPKCNICQGKCAHTDTVLPAEFMVQIRSHSCRGTLCEFGHDTVIYIHPCRIMQKISLPPKSTVDWIGIFSSFLAMTASDCFRLHIILLVPDQHLIGIRSWRHSDWFPSLSNVYLFPPSLSGLLGPILLALNYIIFQYLGVYLLFPNYLLTCILSASTCKITLKSMCIFSVPISLQEQGTQLLHCP